MTIKFIGDLSISDAQVLVALGNKSPAILEFGVGGSTQIFAQCKPKTLVSVETDPDWISLTQKRLGQLPDITHPVFVNYGQHPHKQYDLIFVDGVDHLRRQFAIDTWQLLSIDGVMVFHDTRRFQDFQNAAWVAQLYFNEISKIEVNHQDSNLTLIYKKQHQPYVNWNYTENKPLWAYGGVPNTEDKELWTLKN